MKLFSFKQHDEIKKIQEFFNGVENINCGGCGIAALGLYDTAIKVGEKAEIVFFYNKYCERINFETNKQVLEGKKNQAMSCWHIVTEINSEFINKKKDPLLSEVMDENHFIKHYITRELLINALTHGGWNSMFDREKWVNKIKDFVGLEDNIPTKWIGNGKYVFV